MCSCPDATHSLSSCATRTLLRARAAVHAGLYDAPSAPRDPAPRPLAVQLLDPTYAGDDPTARRFALIEIL